MLMSRILGGCSGHFLITEHSAKHKHCPEDRSGICDNDLWRAKFDYAGWDRKKKQPPVETPVFDKEKIEDVRNIYLTLSRGKRLVLKNPVHLCRIPFLKEMFPDAFFVFCVRNPWHTLQSMTIKGVESFLLRTPRNSTLPHDLLLKAAVSWQESIEIYLRERDENWTAVRYEDLVSDPSETIERLFRFLAVNDTEYIGKAMALVKDKRRNYWPVKNMFGKSRYKAEILEAIKEQNGHFSYPLDLRSLEGNSVSYFFSGIKKLVSVLF